MVPDALFRNSIKIGLLLTSLVSTGVSQLVVSPRLTATSNRTKFAPDRVLVKFRHGYSANAKAAVHTAVGAHSLKQYTAVRDLEAVALPTSLDVRTALRSYRAHPEVEYAEPDYTVHLLTTPNDPLFPQMWNLLNTGQNGGTAGDDIAATLAWNLSTGDHNIVVATIDTGIDYTHPDLIPNLFHNTAVCNGTDDGTNGCYGISTIYYTSNTFDDNGHGTHVSGIIGAAGNNNLGVVGINWNVQLLSCKFLDSTGSGQTSDAISCLDYVLQMKNSGYSIVATNNSWGGVAYSQALTDAIQAQQQAGILFIAASGNQFSDNDIVPTYPANTALPNVTSVAATTRTDALAVFSNVGQHTVHLGAPGQEILSTWPGNNYQVLSGTSMATPQVTGAVALLAAQNPSLDWRGLKNLILTGGDSRTSLAQTVSGKRLNLNGSMTCSGQTLTGRIQPTNNAIAATPNAPVTLEVLNADCAQPAGTVTVTVSPGGQTITLVDDGSGADMAAGDGIYTAQWTPTAVGSYSLTFPGGDTVQAEVLNNYVAAATSFSYVTIAGTNLNLPDDGVAQVTSPFAIPFGGGSFTNIQVGSNGTISFTDSYSPFINSVIPGLAPVPVTLVAPFWQDLYPVTGSAQNVYWAVVGTAPNRQLVVEWRNVRSFMCHNDSAATVTFEVLFSESSSNILFEYADTVFGDNCFFQDNGTQATVGVQVSPTVGTMWSLDSAGLSSGTALLWTVSSSGSINNPVPNVTSISPATVPVNGPSFTLTVNGTGFIPTSTVNFNLVNQTTTYVSSTQLTAEIAAEALAQVVSPTRVWVQNPSPGGGQSNSLTFSLSSLAPTITSLSPSSVTAGSFSFSLTIHGSGFSNGQTTAYWNGQLLGGTFVSSTEFIATIPYNLIAAAGTTQITVASSAAGGEASNASPLTILPQASTYVQPPMLMNGSWLPSGAAAPSPTRFLGWRYAMRAEPDYLKEFSRPRAQAILPLANAGASSSLSGQSVNPSSSPALAGLQLRPLLPADYIPTGVAAGDFNGDGIPDWVVSNGGSNNLWVYLGRGDGTFTQAMVIPLTGQTPVAVAVADLRGIGKLDIIVAEADSQSVGVLLGNGDGTFGIENTYFVPGPPISLAVADLNQDGHLDVLAGVLVDVTFISGPLVTLPGDGTGSFGAPVFEPPLTFGIQVPQSIAVADFEKNGKPDAMVVDPGLRASVFVNDGTGKFKEAQPVFVAFQIAPEYVVAGDVNEDGCPDVLVLDSLDIVRVFLGNCDSTFQAQSNEFGEGDMAGAATLVDVNGDGHLDLVYSGIWANTGGYGQTAGNLLGINFGDGHGNFSNANVYRGGQTSFGLAIADFNRDGHPDIITANQDSDSATIFLNDGKGGFGFPEGEYVGWINGNNSSGPVNAPISNFTPVDVNGDGKPDLVLLEVPATPNPFQAALMLNDGTGHFRQAIRSPIANGSNFYGVTDYLLADFRNTGVPDIVTVSAGLGATQMVFAPNTSNGSFGTQQITTIPAAGVLAAGDFNHDGNLDLAIASAASENGTATVTIYLGHGDGTFSAQTPITFNTNSAGHWIQGLWVGDFNGDGKLDLLVWFFLNVVPYKNNDVYELLGNGDGTFTPAKLVIENLTNPAVADLNHDGRPDVVENASPFVNYPSNSLSQFKVFLCQPDGSFVLNNTYAPFSGNSTFTTTLGTANGGRFPAWIGDFNGDGNVDLAAIQQALNYPTRVYYVQFLLGNGDGTFTPTYEPYYLNASLPNTAFDFTGDGKSDLAEIDGYTSSFQVIPAGSGPTLSLQMISDPVIGSQGSVQVSLASVSVSTTQVALTASDPAITIPASVAVPAGSISQTVDFTIGSAFNSSHVFWIQGTLNSGTATAYGTQATVQGQYGVAISTYWSTEATFPGLPTSDYQLGVTSVAGYSTTVTMGCQGLPTGASCQFGTDLLSIPAGGNNATSFTIATASNTPFGVYPVTVQASDGEITSRLNVTLDVGDYNVSITPTAETVLQNTTASFSVKVTSTNNYGANFTGTCNGIPAPAVCTMNGLNPSIQTNSLAVGSYNFTVALSNGVASRSAAAQLNIGDFSATLSSNSLSVGVGKSGTVTINVTGQNGFADAVALSCNGAPAGSICSINPSSVSPSSAGTTATMTVNVTTKPALSRSQNSAEERGAISLGLIGLVGIVLTLSLDARSRRRWFLSLILLAMIGFFASCGGGGSSGGSSSGGGGGGGGGGGNSSFTLSVQAVSEGVTKNVGTVQVTVP